MSVRDITRGVRRRAPILFGPYFADMANSTHIAFSIFFSVSCSMAVQGLFNIRIGMEDPFASDRGFSDVIDSEADLRELEADLELFLREPGGQTYETPA